MSRDELIASFYLAPIICDDERRARLISEHRSMPIGAAGSPTELPRYHSLSELGRVLDFFRRAPVAGKHVLIRDDVANEWRVARLTGVRGEVPEFIEAEPFKAREDAEHAVFLIRLADFMSTYCS